MHRPKILAIWQMRRLSLPDDRLDVLLDTDFRSSFFPMVCWHNPDKETLDFWGCQGGNFITEINCHGLLRSCSFSKDYAGSARNIKNLWNDSYHFDLFRNWANNMSAPCNSCDYLELCKGGCHCITEVLTGDIFASDPECPFVYNHADDPKVKRK